MPPFKKHIFICLNERTGGRKCCGQAHGSMLVTAFKELVQSHGLKGQVRINKAGCLDACAYGPSMVIYPEAVWYGGVTEGDVAEIFQSHILNDQPVQRLQIDFKLPGSLWLKKVSKR